MIFEICPKDFWHKVEDLYIGDSRHVKDMDDKHIKLGLKYKNTLSNETIFDITDITFQFDVIDKEKFFIAKIKYGI
jgi:hypothetical protein